MKSIRELYRIGTGPSSSHTMGPRKAAEMFLKKHPEARLELVGYADKETAYPSYNLKLSQRRVNTVRNYLVNECGIDPSRLIIDARGDTQRVYNEDYRWNRVVVMRLVENENNKE